MFPRILQSARKLLDAQIPSILAQLIHVQGPSYRPLGSFMVGSPGLDPTGGVSGGCLEDYVLREGLRLTESGPAVLSFDTTHDPENPKPVPGCGGKLHVAVERLSSSHLSLLESISSSLLADTPLALTTTVTGYLPGQTTLHRQLVAPETPPFQHHTDHRWTLTQHLPPPIRLLIFGAGDDAIALARQAHLLSWPATILDRRSRLARPDRFPTDTQVLSGPWSTLLPTLSVSPRTALVCMTHSIPDDAEILPWLLSHPHALYTGLLGPRSRRDVVLAELASQGQPIVSTALTHLHSPIGLDLGEKSPEAIALAISAEILSLSNARKAQPLSLR